MTLVLVAAIATSAHAATSTSFSPNPVVIPQGSSATITISAVGLTTGVPAVVYAEYTLVVPAGYTLSNVQCVGVFAGATPYLIGNTQLGCNFPFVGPGVLGATGNVLTFTLARGASAALGTLTFDPASTYIVNNESTETLGTTNSLVVADAEATIVPTLGTAGLATLAALLVVGGLAVLRRVV